MNCWMFFMFSTTVGPNLIRFCSNFFKTLTLNFQGQIWSLLYLSQKWCDCHETKSKYLDWTLSLKCDQQARPWPWTWPWIFKVKYEICYISKIGPIATKRKTNMSIELQNSNETNGFYLGHDLDLWIFKVKCEFDLCPHACSWPRIFMVNFEIAVSQNGRADWHWTKRMGIGHSLP